MDRQPLPRWLVPGVGTLLLGALAALACLRSWAHEPEFPTKDPAPAPPQLPKEALRYGGKSFEQWRTEMGAELEPAVRVRGFKAFCAFGINGYRTDAVQAMLEVIRDQDRHPSEVNEQAVIAVAADACATIGAAALPLLQNGLKHPRKSVRDLAVIALGEMGSRDIAVQAAGPALVELIRDKDPDVRYDAIGAVESVDKEVKGLIPALIAALKDNTPTVRRNAASVLSRMGERARPAVAALGAATKDSNKDVRTYASYALEQLTGRDSDRSEECPREKAKRLQENGSH